MTSRDLVLPAFFGDALALGAHWIYDDAEIAEAFPDGITHYAAPHSDYHPGKQAGDFTHYGDQTLVLLESLDRHRGFDPAAWRKDWLAFWRGKPNAYLDGATRRTLENSAAGLDRPSESHDLGGAARAAALFALPFSTDEEAVTAARAQTTLTHGDPRVAAVAEFLALATRRILEGATFSQAFQAAATDGMPDFAAAIEASQGTNDDLVDLGLSCDVAKAFPLMVALALKYEDDPVMALRENARLGGDSAARGIPLGLLVGAKHGLAAFPTTWSTQLTKFERISSILDRLALLPA
ncbi:MAG: ADP-ribosylglycohydrolase family protein [Luteolibacter sp.]